MLRGRASILSNPRHFCRGSRSLSSGRACLHAASHSFIRDCSADVPLPLPGSNSLARSVRFAECFRRRLKPTSTTQRATLKSTLRRRLLHGERRVQGEWIGQVRLLGLSVKVTRRRSSRFATICTEYRRAIDAAAKDDTPRYGDGYRSGESPRLLRLHLVAAEVRFHCRARWRMMSASSLRTAKP